MYIFCFSELIRCKGDHRELHFEKGDFACTGQPFAESFTGLVAKGCNELTPLRGFQETWRAHFFFQGWKISTTLEAEGETKSNFGEIMWEFLGESPTWQSLGHIYRHGPEFLLVTHVWVCRTLACPPHVDVCMLTNGATPRVAGRHGLRVVILGPFGFPFISRPGLSSFCNDAFGW